MPGYVMHVAIAQEYLRKKRKEYSKDFINGTIAPDITENKAETHYGKSPAYTNLKNFLSKNVLDTDFMRGYFLHLIADYLFYNKYLKKIEKPQIYYDYDYTNWDLINKYNVMLPEQVKDKIYYKKGTPEILTLELAYKVIDEISDLDLEIVEKEAKEDDCKWSKYKKLI